MLSLKTVLLNNRHIMVLDRNMRDFRAVI